MISSFPRELIQLRMKVCYKLLLHVSCQPLCEVKLKENAIWLSASKANVLTNIVFNYTCTFATTPQVINYNFFSQSTTCSHFQCRLLILYKLSECLFTSKLLFSSGCGLKPVLSSWNIITFPIYHAAIYLCKMIFCLSP